MRILSLLLAALFAVTLQFTPAGFGQSGAAHAATKAERQAARTAKRRAAKRRAKRQAARKRAARQRAARRQAVKRRTIRKVRGNRTTVRRTRKKARVSRNRVVPAKFKRRTVFLRSRQAPGTIIVDTEKRFLYLVRSQRRAIRYGIGVGREGFGWGGTVKVAAKRECRPGRRPRR